jgi:heterokaryon incompatibility protein (HET)
VLSGTASNGRQGRPLKKKPLRERTTNDLQTYLSSTIFHEAMISQRMDINLGRQFKYKPLASSEIRLFRLRPGSKDSDISGLIEHMDLTKNPEYTAVSYAWGDPKITTSIQLAYHIVKNDHEFCTVQVTVSLAAALQHMRRIDEDLVLWIDALCINQVDVEERNREVRQMGTIYSKCTRLYIWLGKLIEDSDPIPDGIEDREAAQNENARAIIELLKACESSKSLSALEPREYKRYRLGVLCLYSRAWFRRLW